MPNADALAARSETHPAAPPPRRTQQERRTTTRLGLLDAAIECLVDAGYSGLTTTEVCQRAGVSQGALFKHFATKAELVAATAEHLFANLIDTFRAGLPPLDAHTDRAAVVVQQLWTVFQQPRLEAAFGAVRRGAHRPPSSRGASRRCPRSTARTCGASHMNCFPKPRTTRA